MAESRDGSSDYTDQAGQGRHLAPAPAPGARPNLPLVPVRPLAPTQPRLCPYLRPTQPSSSRGWEGTPAPRCPAVPTISPSNLPLHSGIQLRISARIPNCSPRLRPRPTLSPISAFRTSTSALFPESRYSNLLLSTSLPPAFNIPFQF
jgi:hypothetical protein